MADKYDEMKQGALRTECKNAGIVGYSNMKLETMRTKMREHDAAPSPTSVKPGAGAKWSDRKAVLSDDDRKQIADEAADRKAGSAPKDDFTMSDEELAKQRRAGSEQDAKNDAIVEGRTANLDALDCTGVGGRCPHCGDKTGDAGENVYGAEAMLAMPDADVPKREYTCGDCGGEWGPKLTAATPADQIAPTAPKPARAPSGTSNGLKIEANRETRNGVTRPSAGGKCRAVWDMLDGIGKAATAKQARERAATNGFDKTTTMVQFYKWRKFQGIEGRQ